MEIEKLTIKRSEWGRGGRGGAPCLSNGSEAENPNRCCLGFVGLAIGLTDDQMKFNISPGAMHKSPWPEFLMNRKWSDGEAEAGFSIYTSDVGSKLMNINDNTMISDEEREARITEIFAANGVEVVFE